MRQLAHSDGWGSELLHFRHPHLTTHQEQREFWRFNLSPRNFRVVMKQPSTSLLIVIQLSPWSRPTLTRLELSLGWMLFPYPRTFYLPVVVQSSACSFTSRIHCLCRLGCGGVQVSLFSLAKSWVRCLLFAALKGSANLFLQHSFLDREVGDSHNLFMVLCSSA